jgi:hypothetical protein
MLTLPVEPNSPIWGFAVHPADPDRIVACSHYGERVVSRNGRTPCSSVGRKRIWCLLGEIGANADPGLDLNREPT